MRLSQQALRRHVLPTALCVGLLTSTGALAVPARAADGPVTVVASGLSGPRQISFTSDKKLVVAESDAGRVTEVDVRSGRRTTLLSGIHVAQGVDARGSELFVTQGQASLPTGEPDIGSTTGQDLLSAKGGQAEQLSDLRAFELANNPDGQLHFGPDGRPVDSVSNPYYVLADTSRLLVADGGGNDIVQVDRRTGRTRAWFVPPVITTGSCATLPQNTPGTFGCDPVPTGIAKAPDGTYWVSTFGGEASGSAVLYHLTPAGTVIGTVTGLSNLTGVAVGNDGTVYASQALAPQQAGPPGAVTRISPDGSRTSVAVPFPTGLAYRDGALYVAALSLAGPGAGQVLRLADAAFPEPVGV
ncbi:ScyD/ScyE family protein [Motilibacter aurantiacus]|uniref:ScyD/ScyE family protein n=1 Tax=Motilibacter aurantiacus TaxID=2714955 RepID=UPI0014082392|nr:ScyD/ScyE family protein [Motilibacter aurantiacus]NHC46206.1 ScyD/ScyE family protein [Motilibacter aurantiacus]